LQWRTGDFYKNESEEGEESMGKRAAREAVGTQQSSASMAVEDEGIQGMCCILEPEHGT
jgi:hypothetical protein